MSKVTGALGSRIPWVGAIVLVAAAVAFLAVEGSEDGDAPAEGPRSGASVEVEVAAVVDGDTIRAEVFGEEESVRYIGIDTPEVDPSVGRECFGERASARNRELVEGGRVRLVFGEETRDRYGRLLAYVYAGGTFVNATLVEGGYARTLEIPPNTAKAGLLSRLERGAAAAARGLWGACDA